MPNSLKYLLVFLGVLNIALPAVMFKLSYLDKRADIKHFKIELKKTEAGNESIKQLLVEPQDYLKYQKTISDRRAVLLDLMPLSVRLLDIQKWVATYARQSEVVIQSIKTVEEGIPFEIQDGSEKLNYQTSTLEVYVQGSFKNLCAYMDFIESEKRATIAISETDFVVHGEEAGVISAKLLIKIIYPV